MRDKYIAMRNAKKVDVNWFYHYYVQEKGPITPQQFVDIFEYDIQRIEVPGGFVENRIIRDKGQIIEHLDKKFELTLLFSKEGAFIKVVE
jgi:hypothetical protein